MEAIDLNIQQFHYMTSAERKAHNQLRQLVVENYVEKFHLQPISEEEHVVMSTSLDGTQLSFNRGPTNCVPFAETFAGTRQRGSYNQRQGNLHQNWLDKIKVDSQLKFCPSRSRTLQGRVFYHYYASNNAPCKHSNKVYIARLFRGCNRGASITDSYE